MYPEDVIEAHIILDYGLTVSQQNGSSDEEVEVLRHVPRPQSLASETDQRAVLARGTDRQAPSSYLPDELRVGKRELAFEVDEKPAEAEEHVEAIVRDHQLEQTVVEHTHDFAQLRELNAHAKLLTLEVVALQEEDTQPEEQLSTASSFCIVRGRYYHHVHNAFEAPEGVHFIFHDHHDGGQQVVHALDVA